MRKEQQHHNTHTLTHNCSHTGLVGTIMSRFVPVKADSEDALKKHTVGLVQLQGTPPIKQGSLDFKDIKQQLKQGANLTVKKEKKKK